jgi:hypothetical protein
VSKVRAYKFETDHFELTRLGWKRVAENRPFPKEGII